MKTIKIAATFAMMIFLTAGCSQVKYTNTDSNPDDERITFFELNDYGHWIHIEPFGDVWKPDTGYNWSPYVLGHWELTDRGWMWFSDEPYAWIVYHYGNWAFTNEAGWVWVPGNDWYPNRVRWLSNNDYIGWAPLPPAGLRLPNYYDPSGERYWMIVHTRDFDQHEIYKYRVPVNTINSRRDWDAGRAPEPTYIRTATGRNIQPVVTQTDNVRGGRRDLTRIRIREEKNPRMGPMPRNDNQNNFTPPPVGRTSPQGNGNTTNNRTNTGERNVTPRTQNIQPPKTRGDLVEPNRVGEKTVKPRLDSTSFNESKRAINEQPVEKKNAPPPPQIIRNEKTVPPKTRGDLTAPNRVVEKTVKQANESVIEKKNLPRTQINKNENKARPAPRVLEPAKKPVKVEDIKKQKKEEKNLKAKEVKKVNPKEKKAPTHDK